MRCVLWFLGHALSLALLALLVGLISLLLAGCGDQGGGAPPPREHGWDDGLYAVTLNGQTGLITVDGGQFALAGDGIEAHWVETRTRGAAPVSGWWYQGRWRGVAVGIRAGYHFRIGVLSLQARPVQGAG